MRVLFVNHTGDFSGAEVAMIRLVHALPSSVTSAVACPPTGRLADRLRTEGIELLPITPTDISFRLHPVHTSRGLAQMARAVADVRRHARAWGADVVHANGSRGGLVALAARRRSGPRLVVQIHDNLPGGRVAHLVRRVLAARADVITAVSRAASQAFDAGLTRPVAETVYIGIDHERFRPDGHDRAATRRSLGVPEDAPLLGVVAQISPWKGQIVAIEAMPEILRAHPRARLALIGDISFAGPGVRYDNEGYLRELHERVDALGLHDSVVFAGRREDIGDVMAALDLMLLPSWNEPFGTAIAEAMACGVVPLVSAEGGPPEFVEDGVSGRTLPARDPGAWARATIELLDDGASRAAMAERAVVVADRFNDEAYVESCLSIYRRALAREATGA